jgi:hypothetical protein
VSFFPCSPVSYSNLIHVREPTMDSISDLILALGRPSPSPDSGSGPGSAAGSGSASGSGSGFSSGSGCGSGFGSDPGSGSDIYRPSIDPLDHLDVQ